MVLESTIYEKDIEAIAKENLPWEMLDGKSVLLTGASGLLGTVLVDALMLRNEKYGAAIKIYAVGRNLERAKAVFKDYWGDKRFQFLQLDVNNQIKLDIQMDYIVHAASNTHPRQYANDPIGSILTNLMGTHNLLEYGRTNGIKRFIFLSSVEIYGNARQSDDVFDEKYCGYLDCNTLRAAYPEGKRAGEALCQGYIEKYGVDIVIPRLSRIYGPTMKPDDSKAMSQFIRNSVHRENIVLKSKGLQRYSYTYAADAVMGILYVWLKGKCGEAYNIAGNEILSLKDIAGLLSGLAGTKVIFDLPDELESKGYSKADNAVMDSRKIKSLGWEEKNMMADGLRKTVECLKE